MKLPALNWLARLICSLRLTRLASFGLVGAILIAGLGHAGVDEGWGVRSPWVGIAITVTGLSAAAAAGSRNRGTVDRDRRDEAFATLVLVVLALAAVCVSREQLPPRPIIFLVLGVLAVAGAIIGCNQRTPAACKREENSTLSHWAASWEVVKRPLVWRGLTLLGVMLAASAQIFESSDRDSARQAIANVCEGLDTRPSGGCDALALRALPKAPGEQ
ncbi:hypothetical protein OJ997_10265 [Solirubrobacter phytolaccae]|uniref:Uncharacterized protein n=1 Tax=Solirubrobacter phytolaccae TaxID=1404360 RepID=A0A9X3N719_9ACTN|nr:hypothetical protein [Solirubrobacter phytolaccae]MDA0180676.1 hypothetical protein [Solirubrobacter phytolaccae]